MTTSIHQAVTVVENRLGEEYSQLIKDPFFEAEFVYHNDGLEEFERKKQWLRETFGLVYANPDADAVGELQKQVPGALENILVFEDERVDGQWKGSWRVRCDFKEGESLFYFRRWDAGYPEKIGEDTMAETIRDFQRQFPPSAIYQFGRNYQIEINWTLAEALSQYFPYK